MIEYTKNKIQGIVTDIKDTQAMITLHETGDDPLDPFMAKQFRTRKHKLYRELLAELALTDLSFREMNPFIKRLTTYLESLDEAQDLPQEILFGLSEAEKLMVA
jgi:hypothetical protein